MSAADEAWQEWRSRGIGFSEEQDDAHEDTFMFAYRRALEDAADAQERLSTGPRAMGSKAVQFKRMLFAEWLRDRASNMIKHPPSADAEIPPRLLQNPQAVPPIWQQIEAAWRERAEWYRSETAFDEGRAAGSDEAFEEAVGIARAADPRETKD